MSELGHIRQIDPLPTLSACPLRSDRVRAFRGSPEYCEVGRRPPDRDQFARGCLGPHLFKNAEGAEGQGARCRGSDAIRAARLPKLMTRGSTPSLPAI
jgi:hypothetical protein